jgi:hypothetical protein
MALYDYRSKPYTAKDKAVETIIPISVRYIPLILHAVERQKDRNDWVSDDDFSQGYTELCEIQWNMLMGGLDELIESNRQIYRLLDSGLNGTAYTASGDNPPVVTPAIPAAPGAPAGITAGLRKQLLDMQGLNPGGWFGIGASPTTLADVAAALKQQSPGAVTKTQALMAELAGIGDIEGGISAATGVINTIGTWLGDEETAISEGLLVTSILANIAAQAAMMESQKRQTGQLLAKMDRLIKSLDGGATPAPDTNVLATLEHVDTMLS